MITKKLSLLIALSFIGGNCVNATITEQEQTHVAAAKAEHENKECNCSKKTKKRVKKSKAKRAKKAAAPHDNAKTATSQHDVAKEHGEHTNKERSTETPTAMDHTAVVDATAMKTAAAGGTTGIPAS